MAVVLINRQALADACLAKFIFSPRHIALLCVRTACDGKRLFGNGNGSSASLTRLSELCTVSSAYARFTVAGSSNLEITIASLDSPDAIQPAVHIWTDSQLKCLKVKDDLPKFREEQAAQS